MEGRLLLPIVVFIERGHVIKGAGRQSHLFLAFSHQRNIEPLTLFDMTADQIPLVRRPFSMGCAPRKKHSSIVDKRCTHNLCHQQTFLNTMPTGNPWPVADVPRWQ
nr:hypothetical protein [Rhizobium wenxiniae]